MRDLVRATSEQYRKIRTTIRQQVLDYITEADFSIERLVPENQRQLWQETREQGQQLMEVMAANQKNFTICQLLNRYLNRRKHSKNSWMNKSMEPIIQANRGTNHKEIIDSSKI